MCMHVYHVGLAGRADGVVVVFFSPQWRASPRLGSIPDVSAFPTGFDF
jgi:hypothetical protein